MERKILRSMTGSAARKSVIIRKVLEKGKGE